MDSPVCVTVAPDDEAPEALLLALEAEEAEEAEDAVLSAPMKLLW